MCIRDRFTTADISLDMAMRIVDYKEIVTKISDFLVFNGQCIKGTLHKFERGDDKRIVYLFSKDKTYGLGVDYDLQRWISEGKKYHKTSPFWLRIKAINDKGDWVSCSQEHLAVLQDKDVYKRQVYMRQDVWMLLLMSLSSITKKVTF